jgi:XTP/dITP diphosphohydrolase
MNGEVHYFEGEIKGTITFEPRGKNGFGYDPLFIPTGYRSTFAEMTAETKNQISHRALAVQKLCAFLESNL